MARLIRNDATVILKTVISTVFEDESVVSKELAVGDVVTDLRYVANGNIETVSGRITGITYGAAVNSSTYSRSLDKDYTNEDFILKSLTLDASAQYESKIVSVPFNEIVEDAGVENVKRMKCEPKIQYNCHMVYSNASTQDVSIEVGDILNNVRIMDLDHPGEDIVGKYTVMAFRYRATASNITITQLVLKGEDDKIIAIDPKYILAMNEVYVFTVSSSESIANIIEQAADGDTISLGANIEVSTTGFVIDGKNVDLNLNGKSIYTSNSSANRVRITNAKVTIDDSSKEGKVIAASDYSNTSSAAIMEFGTGSDVTIKYMAVDAVRGAPAECVDNGQFGISATGNSKLTINDGDFKAGWYAYCSHSSNTDPSAVTNINGGEFTSVADFCLYLPGKGITNIYGGTFKGAAGVISINNGTCNIFGGEFITTGGGDTGEWSDGTSGQAAAVINVNARYGDCILNISGGKFKTDGDSALVIAGTSHTVTINITGGLFSSKPNDEWIADGYTCTDEPNAEGYYIVHSV